ncbi:alcohol dehydrogenase [Acrasis kona]|uniref:alcohol dehydrogenase n=1 Tax=Acrasis kona TaxID=1008807 RepID=A0AAW2ZNP9_9EUKA
MTEVPKEQVAALFSELGNPGKITFEKRVVPEPNVHQIIVNIKYTGVCHTDLHTLRGEWPRNVQVPWIGGHEGAGIVVKVGSAVSEVEVGDAVGIKWINSTCNNCEFCMASHESNCQSATYTGFTVDGTFQQYAATSGRYVTKIPKNVSLEDAAPIMCAGVTVYRALKEANVRVGEWVVLPGAGGGLGHLAVQYARAMGLRVLGIDTGDDKEKLVKQLGAEVFIDYIKCKNVVEQVKMFTNGGPHATLVLSTSSESYNQAIQWSRPRSTLVTVSLPPNAKLNADIFSLTVKSLRIVGSYVGNRLDAVEALDYVARGLVKPHYKILPFRDLPKVFEQMSEAKVTGRIVLKMDE